MPGEPIKVECYSGYCYPEHPHNFICGGRTYWVKDVLKTWKENRAKPGVSVSIHYRLKTKENEIYEICYVERQDQWFLVKKLKDVSLSSK